MSKQTDKNGMNKMQTINRKRPRTYLVIGFAAAILLVIVSVGIFMLAKKDAGEPQTIDAEGYVQELNETLALFEDMNGEPPASYAELQFLLARYGFCEQDNAFLLNMLQPKEGLTLVWYPKENRVQTYTEKEREQIEYTPYVGLGNGVVGYADRASEQKSFGYLLCTNASEDERLLAKIQLDYYGKSGAEMSSFEEQFGSVYRDVAKRFADRTLGETLESAFSCQKRGYVYSFSLAESLESQVESEQEEIVLLSESEGDSITGEKAAQALATLSLYAEQPYNARRMAGRSVRLCAAQPEGLIVELSGVKLCPIAPQYAQEDLSQGDVAGSFSMDFCGAEIRNASLSAGSVWRDSSDVRTSVGLFGILIGTETAPITVSNLTVRGFEAEESAGAAGVIAGYVFGNVRFEGITVDGAAPQTYGAASEVSAGETAGAIAGSAEGLRGGTENSIAVLRDCRILNLQVRSDRYAGGLIGGWKGGVSMRMEQIELRGVSVISESGSPQETDGSDRGAGLIAAYAVQNANTSSVMASVLLSDCHCEDRSTEAQSQSGWNKRGTYAFVKPSSDLALLTDADWEELHRYKLWSVCSNLPGGTLVREEQVIVTDLSVNGYAVFDQTIAAQTGYLFLSGTLE